MFFVDFTERPSCMVRKRLNAVLKIVQVDAFGDDVEDPSQDQ